MDREEENEGESIGRVSYRRRDLHNASSLSASRTEVRGSYAYSFAPLRPESVGQSPYSRRAGSPLSSQDLLPPDLDAPDETKESGFKNWLTTGILDVLGAAAGVTLSTTGKLVAPPLHMTKTIILPGLLALLVDTLDAITPPRVQDWFRILSSSVHHLIVVLGNTDKGKMFSTQVYVMLQDVLQALSAPESRQVLVDGMATSVKFAAALKTPEMKEFLEQLSTLGIRLLDAASSGKAKQLMQDTKDLTWKGIEMATDPATTLALAEVTAHLCHALEDTQNALNPTPRRNRNAQNQNIYLNPFQMADFPEQVTMEEVILSCLGRVDDHGTEAVGDDVASLPSRLTLDDDLSLTEPDYRDWKERKERVNVHLLREKILIEGLAGSGTEKATRPVVDVQQEKSRNEEAKVGVGVEDAGGFRIEQSRTTTNHTQDEDMEDISLSCVPGRRRLGLMDGDKRTVSSEGLPAVQQFYQRLDELLEQNRYRQGSIRPRLETTINNSLVTGENENISPGVWKARMTKMHQKQRSTEVHRNARNPNISRMSKNYQVLMIAILAMVTMLFVAFSFFTVYGIYSVMCGRSNNAPSTNQEIIIRIVREIVHVTEDGKIIGDSGPRALSQEELDKVGQKIESLFR